MPSLTQRVGMEGRLRCGLGWGAMCGLPRFWEMGSREAARGYFVGLFLAVELRLGKRADSVMLWLATVSKGLGEQGLLAVLSKD